MTLHFEVMGDVEISRGFSDFADKVKDLRPAFKEIVTAFREMEEKQFATEGGYGAGGWPPLAPSTLARKPPGLPLLVRTGRLRSSLVSETGDSVVRMEPLELAIGTAVPYGAYHQKGTRRRMPARPLICLPEAERIRWHKIIHDHLVKLAKESLKPGETLIAARAKR